MRTRNPDTRRPWFYGILADPWRKLISIGLGILLWYYLNASITKTYSAPLSLQFKQTVRTNHIEIKLNSTNFGQTRFLNGDSRQLLSGVVIDLKGGNRLIDELKKPGQMMFEVKFTENEVQTTNPPYVQFRLEDLHHKTSPEYDKLLAGMTPSTVRVELERNASKSLLLTKGNVELILKDVDPARIQEPKFRPEQIKIFGPSKEIQLIDGDTKLFTASIPAQRIKSVTEISFELNLAPRFKQKGIQLKDPFVTYSVEPERVKFLLKDVPVVLDTQQVAAETGAKYEVKGQKSVDIQIAASGELYDALYTHIQTGKDLHEVPASWCKEHARLRVFLRPENIREDSISPRQPTLHLFELDSLDREKPFRPGPDFVVPEQSRPIVTIVKRSG